MTVTNVSGNSEITRPAVKKEEKKETPKKTGVVSVPIEKKEVPTTDSLQKSEHYGETETTSSQSLETPKTTDTTESKEYNLAFGTLSHNSEIESFDYTNNIFKKDDEQNKEEEILNTDIDELKNLQTDEKENQYENFKQEDENEDQYKNIQVRPQYVWQIYSHQEVDPYIEEAIDGPLSHFSESDKKLLKDLGYNSNTGTFNEDFCSLSKDELQRLKEMAVAIPAENSLHKALYSNANDHYNELIKKEQQDLLKKTQNNNIFMNHSASSATDSENSGQKTAQKESEKEDEIKQQAEKKEIHPKIVASLKPDKKLTEGEITTLNMLEYSPETETFKKHLPPSRESLEHLRSAKNKLDREKTHWRLFSYINDEITRVENNKTPQEWEKIKKNTSYYNRLMQEK